MICVKTFGGFRVTDQNTAMHLVLSPKAREILAFLFTRKECLAKKDKIISVFWPDRTKKEARQSFSTCIWELRKAARTRGKSGWRSIVNMHGDEVQVNCSYGYDVDALKFAKSIPSILGCDAYDGTCADIESVRSRYAPLAEYAGSFMEGYDSDWILPERSRFEDLYCRGMKLQMQELARVCDIDGAIETARTILAIDPFQECVQCDLIRLLALSGNRAAAIREYNRLADLLKKELGVEPLNETSDVRNRIVSGAFYENYSVERGKVGLPIATYEDR